MHQTARLTPAGRALLVRRVLEEGWTPAEPARAQGVSCRTAYKWVGRYEAKGKAGLLDRSSRPHASPTRLSGWRVKRIRRLRKRRWTGAKIARFLSIPRSTVSLWLRRLGMGRLRDLEVQEQPVRYERDRPCELLHLDTKKLGRIGCVGHRIHGDRRRSSPGVGWEYLHVCVDDATRLSYSEVLANERAVTVTAFAERAVAFFAALGVSVERVMTDNGSGYVFTPVRRQPGTPRDPTHPDPAVPASNKREGGALHPDRAQRVGLPEALPDLGAPDGRPGSLPAAIQWTTRSLRDRRPATAQLAPGAPVNNVLSNYS